MTKDKSSPNSSGKGSTPVTAKPKGPSNVVFKSNAQHTGSKQANKSRSSAQKK